MNKQTIKYYNDDIKKQFEKIIKDNKILNDIKELFFNLGKMPYLYQINVKDNEIILLLSLCEEVNVHDSIIVKFNLLNPNLLEVSESNHNYHDNYDLSLSGCFTNCKRRVFENYDNNVAFSKQYYVNNDSSFKTTKNNEEYEFFNYHFSNSILDANIRLFFREKYQNMNNYNEEILINDIIKQGHNIKTINELYNFINERLNSPKFQLYIDNINNNDKDDEIVEYLKIENGYLSSSLIKYEQDGNSFIARFQNNKMNISEVKSNKRKGR